jgi:hypothetical protein
VPTIEEIDALVGPATPHFAYQIRARVEELIRDLPEENPVRRHGVEKMELLDRLGHASSKADPELRTRRSAAASTVSVGSTELNRERRCRLCRRRSGK